MKFPRMPKFPTAQLAGAGLSVIVVAVAATLVSVHNYHEKLSLTSSLHIPVLLATPEATKTASSSDSAATSVSTTSVSASLHKAPLAAITATPVAAVPTISTTTIAARELTASGAQLLKSIVNIVCISGDSSIPSVSASGVIIDPRGIIVTASHVAQLFLLQDYLGTDKVQCLIRDGSPARRAYTAEPIYVSAAWLAANPDTLTDSSPVGTGRNDVALLGITGTATSTPVPNVFPYMPLASSDPNIGDKVTIGSYGAQYLTASEINYSLYPILTFGSIGDRYTFGTNTVDLISVQGTAASQEGSSGGGIANDLGQLIGIITTSSISGDIQTRTLNAVTAEHLRASYLEDTGNDLDSTLSNESVPALVAGFANESKTLGAQLAKDINAQ